MASACVRSASSSAAVSVAPPVLRAMILAADAFNRQRAATVVSGSGTNSRPWSPTGAGVGAGGNTTDERAETGTGRINWSNTDSFGGAGTSVGVGADKTGGAAVNTGTTI